MSEKEDLQRLKKLIEENKTSERKVLRFIDEEGERKAYNLWESYYC